MGVSALSRLLMIPLNSWKKQKEGRKQVHDHPRPAHCHHPDGTSWREEEELSISILLLHPRTTGSYSLSARRSSISERDWRGSHLNSRRVGVKPHPFFGSSESASHGSSLLLRLRLLIQEIMSSGTWQHGFADVTY